MSELTTFEMVKYIQRRMLTKMAEVIVYKEHWSDEFRLKEIDELVDSIKKQDGYFDVDPKELTEDEVKTLDFRKWDDSAFYLIPIWLWHFLTEDVKEGKDNDHRMGFLAFGVSFGDDSK